SAGVAYRAVRVEGDRCAAREGCCESDGGREAQGSRLDDRAGAEGLRGQGVGVSVLEIPGGRSYSRPRDEIDRRGDGDGTVVRRGLRQGAARLGSDAADTRRVSIERTRSRQAG